MIWGISFGLCHPVSRHTPHWLVQPDPEHALCCLQVAGMLGSEDAMLGHAATRILAAAGSDIAAAHSRAGGAELDLQHLACKLTELMARGPYKVTKAAVR